MKKKYKRGNQMPLVTKDLSSKLRSNYLKNKSDANRMLHKKQIN